MKKHSKQYIQYNITVIKLHSLEESSWEKELKEEEGSFFTSLHRILNGTLLAGVKASRRLSELLTGTSGVPGALSVFSD